MKKFKNDKPEYIFFTDIFSILVKKKEIAMKNK